MAAVLSMYREPRVLDFGAHSGLGAPILRPMPLMAKIAAPSRTQVVQRVGMLGARVYDVRVDGTDVDLLGERFYWGAIDGISFCWRADRFEAFMGVNENAPKDAHS